MPNLISDDSKCKCGGMEAITINESKRRVELEAVIKKGKDAWLEVGLALTEMRDRKLYRNDFATFKEYCEKVWKWSDKRAYQLIDAAEETSTSGRTFSSEREARRSRKERKQAAKPKPAPVATVPAEMDDELEPADDPPRVHTYDKEFMAAMGNPAPQLSPEAQAALDALNVQDANSLYLRECITGSSCDRDVIAAAIDHLPTLRKALAAYLKTLK